MDSYSNKTISNNNDKGELIKKEIGKYLHYWIWFLLSILLGLLLSYLYIRYNPRIYNSTAKIQILNKTKGLELPSAAFVFNRSNINLENEIEILRSYRIIEKVADKLSLTVTFYEEGNIRTSEIDQLPFSFIKKIDNFSIENSSRFRIEVLDDGFKVFQEYVETPIMFKKHSTYESTHDLPFNIRYSNKELIRSDIGKIFIVQMVPLSAATRSLKSQIKIGVVGKGSDLLNITHTSESKQKSERIVNTLVEVFNEDGINDRQQVSKRTIRFVEDRFKFLAKELDSIESEKKDFKQENDLISIETSTQIELENRNQAESRVFETETQLMLAELLMDELNLDENNIDLLPSNIGIQSANINSLIEQYNTLIQNRNALLISAGKNNPAVVEIDAKLIELRQNMRASLEAYEKQLQASISLYSRRDKEFSSQVTGLPLKEKLLNSIERQRIIKETLYLFLLQKREEAAINIETTEPAIKVVEYALSDGGQISPNPGRVYLFGILGGFFIPFGIVYFILLLDTKIKTKSDLVQKANNTPILAELPVVKDRDLIFSDPTDNTAQAEAFRILSSNVNYILPAIRTNSKGRVIYCTSTIKGEGKTYTAVNLSLALASLNKKVLLVGADLRNPQIHNYLHGNYNKESNGLTNYLHEEAFDWKSSVIRSFKKHPLHDTLLSGSIPPNPAQLLTNGRFQVFLEEAKEIYDYVVVDTAPTILVTDTTLISQLADATIYMVRSDHTDKKLIEFSQDLDKSGRIKNMAYVLNGVSLSKSYGYGYNYGYSYGYGNKG